MHYLERNESEEELSGRVPPAGILNEIYKFVNTATNPVLKRGGLDANESNNFIALTIHAFNKKVEALIRETSQELRLYYGKDADVIELTVNEQTPQTVFKHPFFTFYSDKGEIEVGRDRQRLKGPTRTKLLNTLIREPNKVFSYEKLQSVLDPDLWYSLDAFRTNIKSHVIGLREQLDFGRNLEAIIATIPSYGLMLLDPSKENYSPPIQTSRTRRSTKKVLAAT